MAVEDGNTRSTTEGLILPQPRRHFKISVKPVHWQLRSLIGAEKRSNVYFPAGSANRHVQRLNTVTNETETVKILPFEPRCLVAGNGWICCGGETGEFSAIQVDEDNPADYLFALGVSDARPPMSIDSSPLEESILSLLSRSRSNKSLIAKSKKFGRERVNCITMWSPPSLIDPAEGAYTELIAVLSNNDKHVTIVSLHNQEALETVSLPDCVNRAVLSPDGRFLIAICDDPYLYIHERCAKPSPLTGALRSIDRSAFEWTFRTRIHLQSQKIEDRSDNRGSFAACFSNTGRYLAVGTQYGTISIFDAGLLTESKADPLLTSFTSSRPYADQGAIRDMAFAPGPLDLLAWTEDRGRVGIADMRRGFADRQILYLDKTDTYDHITVLDRSSIDPRLLDQRSDRPDNLASSAGAGLGLSTESRRPPRPEALANIERYNQPLTRDETMVLEALQEHGRRRAQRAAELNGSGARFPWMERGSRPSLGSDSPRTRERSASVSRAVNDIWSNIREERERLRDGSERVRAVADENDPDRPRRPGGLGGATASSDSPGSAALGVGYLRDLRAVARLAAASSTSSGRLVDLDLLENIAFDGHDSPVTVADADNRRRERAAYLLREWVDSPVRRSYGSREPRDPHDTAGLSWSEDGQVLFVGAENGIYEFRVDMFRRKLLPSIEFL